jgi:hypothetical protein
MGFFLTMKKKHTSQKLLQFYFPVFLSSGSHLKSFQHVIDDNLGNADPKFLASFIMLRQPQSCRIQNDF